LKIAEPNIAAKARWVISTQLIISIFVAVVFLTKGTWESLAAVYGGLVSICITLLLMRGFVRANEAAKTDPKRSMQILYVGAIQRFVLVIGLLALGIGLIKLDALAIMVGFALTQAGYFIYWGRDIRNAGRG